MADAAHDQRKTSLEAFLADCDKLDADGDNKELITIVRNAERENFEAEFRGRIERKIQKEAMQTRVSYGGLDAGGPGPDWGKVIVDLGTERDELKARWEAADKEVKRLNQVNFELVTARHGPLRPRKRALIQDGDAGAEQFQSADGVLIDASGFITRLPGEDDLAYQERCYDRLDVEFERATHAYNAAKDEKIRANNRADKALDDLEAARKEIARLNEVRAQRDSAVAELRVALGKLEGQLEAAQTENARLHQLNLELVTARHDALLSDIVRLKKRARVEDNNVAADEAKLDAGEETFRSAGGVLVDAEGFIARLPGEDSLAYSERCYNLLDVEFGKMIGEANRMRREVSKTREKNRCLEDELKDAREEIARLNEALQDELRAQRDSAVAELAQKKRRRLDDDAAANY